MAIYYLETSAFLKRYKEEKGSHFINHLIEKEASKIFYLNLTIAEISKVFFRLYKYPNLQLGDRQISKEIFQNLQNQFAADLSQMRKIFLTEEIIKNGNTILERGYVNSVIDLLHLSAFLIIRKEFLDVKLVSADKEIIELAKKFIPENDIINPEIYE
jgi:predicted nucleic acid-binding protein